MLAELGQVAPRMASVANIASVPASRALGRYMRHALIDVRGMPVTRRRTFTTKPEESAASGDKRNDDHGTSTASDPWGHKMSSVGFFLYGASLLPRFAMASRWLRFAGAGPMLLGSVVTAYEIGGWRLILGAPALVCGSAAALGLADAKQEARLKSEIASEIRAACPSVPDEVVIALCKAEAREYETNKVKLEAECLPTDGDKRWRIEVRGERQLTSLPWSITLLKVSASEAAQTQPSGGLPPQSRHWGAVSPQWKEVWNRL